ncbi:hypothetical protein CGI24_17700 [Vibrio parahaemolyticus]|uniref:restriction endonuclease subunit S n=1 Tax=Vibrio parahaemolyticus TaxID=670 RepID=UPI0011237CEC|nr:restriction endonuclease subunit S [Vibrio parahaemolyticus]TOK18767.1 hypothetical protein CGI24_17700 [Vibrio parahaemolyticus]
MNENVPNGWALYPLNTVLKEVKKKNKSNDNYPVFSVTKYNGFVRSDSYFKKQVFSRDLTTYKVVSEGQFAYATIHLDEGSLGLLKGVEKGLVSPMYTVFETTGSIDNVFLFYLLKSDYFMRLYPSLGQGSIDRRASIPFKVLSGVEFLSPPLSEQKKIAAILTSVDDVIEQTQAQINKLKDLKTGMMQELLTRGVGVDGKPHTEFKDSPVGRIPKGWEVEALKEFTSFISYGFTNPMPEADDGPYMITAKDVNNLKIQYSNARRTTRAAYEELLTRKSRPDVNDILLTKDGTLGRVALVTEPNCCINQSVAVITPNERVIPKFLLYLLASPAYQQEMLDKAGGSTIKHIYITVIDKMFIAVPSLEEQEKLVGILDSVFCKLELVEQKLNKLKAMKKALMQDLLTGKVRVKV